MRLTYYRYSLLDLERSSKVSFDLRGFLVSYCQQQNTSLKTNFDYDENQLFLFHQTGGLFLFVVTRDPSIIHKINTEAAELFEVQNILEHNESLGFASYVYIDNHFFAFCSSQLAPRAPAFPEFVNEVFKKIRVNSHTLLYEPLMLETTMDQVQRVDFIGKTSLEVRLDNTLGQDILRTFHLHPDNDQLVNLQAIKIQLVPVARKNIAKIAKSAMNRASGNGLSKVVVSGRQEQQDRLIDMYVDGAGILFDNLNTKDKAKIYDRIQLRITQNRLLQSRLREIASDETIQSLAGHVLNDLCVVDAWSGTVPAISPQP